MPRPCQGTFRLVFAGGRTKAESWKLAPGQSVEDYYFLAPLSAADRKGLARAPASSVALRLVTRGAGGRRITSRFPFPGPSPADQNWPRYAVGVDCNACAPDP
jgi:hypothetical protein